MKFDPVFRPHDQELLGFIAPDPLTQHWQACTVFKYPLSTFPTPQQAQTLLHTKGLPVLMETWSFFDEALQDWFACQLVEVSPDRVRYRIIDYGHPQQDQERTIVHPMPATLRLGG